MPMSSYPDKPGAGVLIAGGSGLIGRYLTSLLLSRGYAVSHLSRKQDNFGRVRVYRWDPERGIANSAYFEGSGYIINLSGANIGEKRWTPERKTEIVNSRTGTTKLLYKIVTENNIKLKAYISASAVGYYGSAANGKIFTETDPPGSDFLAETCRLWEEAADRFEKTGIRTVKIRSGVVIEKNDSALSKLMMPARFGFLVQTGNGRQYMPWIHISDLCGIYLKAIEDQTLSGSFNGVAPSHITHGDFVRILARVLGKPVLPVPVPALFLRAAMGQMADVVLKGNRVSAEKIIKAGYKFTFPGAEEALKDVLAY